MKVDTDGMVAIIQGLRDSGLAVTLVGHRGNIAKANAIPITHAKSSVETRVTPKAMINAAAQLCDDRYTSSYQIAHCNARPTSPCPNSPEFPRQRSDFSNLNTTQGNFEIGGQGVVNTRAPIKISIHHRNEYTIPERSLLTNSQSSRGTLAFVSSLRKYPSIIPERNYSSEFVQRIIAYTQAKNFSKSSYHSKLMRKLRNKGIEERSADTVASGKVCKGIQTYESIQTRRKERDEESERRNAKRRRYRSASPADPRDIRHKNEQMRETYDYLNPRHYRSKITDVRYLSDVTRALKDTLRQICDDQPQGIFQVCPNVQNRYSRHRREHHRDSMDRSSTDSNNSKAQVSVPMISRGVSCLPSCNAMPGTYMPTCPPRPQLCCFCMKPLPCSCVEGSEDEIFEKNLEEVVCSWLEEIPVCSNDKPQNQTLREIMVMDLIDKLKSLYHDEHFEENAKNEITQCVNNLPMWCPGDKRDQDVFKTQIIDNLMNKIRGLSKDSQKYKEEIAKWLNDISFYCKDFQGKIIDINTIKEKLVEKILALAINPPSDENLKSDIVAILNEFPIKVEGDTYIDNFAEMLVDKIQTLSSESANRKVLTEQILEWLEDIPELSASKSENQKTAEQLANMFQELVKDNKNESDIENKISSWLSETLKSKGKSLDAENHNNLVKKLLGKINAVSGMKDEEIRNEILNILKDIPDLDTTTNKIKNMAGQLAKKIRELQTSGKEIESEDMLKDEINNWLSNLSKNTGIQITPEDKEKLVNKLLSATKNVSKQRKRWSKQGDLNKLISDQISQIFVNNAVELDKDTKKNIQNKISDLVAINLDNIQSTGGDDIKTEIVDILEKEAGVDTRKANQIADEIISITKTMEIPRQQRILQELDFMNSLRGEVNNILDGIDIENKDEVELEISNILADQALRGTSNEETRERLIDVLKNLNLSDEEAEKIVSKLMEMQKDLSDYHLTPDISQTSKSFSSMQKQIFIDNAQNEILDFTENLTGDSSVHSTKKIKVAAAELAKRVCDTISESNSTPADTQEQLNDEVLQYFNDVEIPKPKQKEQSKKLVDRLQKIPFTTSTPRSSNPETERRFRRGESQGPISPITSDSTYMSQVTKPSTITGDKTIKKEKSYMSQQTDPSLRSTSDEEIKKRLIDVLKSLNLSDEEAEKIAFQLMGMQKKLPDHLTPNKSQTSKSLTPMQKQIFIDNAQNEILDFTENLTGDSSVHSTKKIKVAAAELAKRVSDTISESNNTPADKQVQLNDEVLQYFNDVEIPRPKQKEQAKKLVDRLQKVPFTTSTPRSSKEKPYMSQRSTKGSTTNQYQQPPSKKEKPYMSEPTKSSTKTDYSTNKKEKSYMSQPTKSSTTVTGDSDNEFQQPSSKKEKPSKFQLSSKTSTKTAESTNKKEKQYMSQPTKSSTIITGDSDSTYNRYQQPPSNKEKQYMSQLSTRIDSWLKKLPINFDKEDGKVFKEAMIKDLVSDIVDRQKYLQLNPNAKTSDEEELEHLKYQVFRWLNKLPDAKELLPSIAKTRELMNLLKGISVPQLTKDKGATLDSQCTSDLSSIQDEISSWFEAIPARLFKSKDKSYHKKMIQELADNIDEYQKNNTLSETVLDQLILDWLQKMLADSKQSLKNKSESLKALLFNKGLVTSLDLSLNDSQFTEIDEWIQSLPLKSRRTSRDLKQMENIKQDLMKNLKQIQEQYPPGTPNYKIKMKEAIKKYLQLFPIEPNKRNDQAFLQQKVEELFEKLNGSSAEHRSKRPSINDTELQNIVTNPADIFYSDIENWVDNLPIFPGDTPEEKERVKALKQNIISKLLNKIGELNMKPDIFQDDVLYEDLLKDEIDDLLNSLPQTPELVSNMESLKEILIEKVLQAKQKAQNEMEGHAYKQQLRDAISTTLPSVDKITEEEQVPFEILKDAVADAYINLNYSLDNESKNKYKQKIADEINKFSNDYLKRYPASPMNPNKLNQELFTALQKVPLPKDDTIKSQVEQVRIKDQIHEWLNDILLDDLSPAQQLQKNKIVSVLANALHETEKEKRSNPDIDAEDRFRQDIIKWAKKLPLNPEAKANVDEEADKLIERLKSTEDTRRFSISTLKQRSTVSQYQIPPCALTENDKAHLQRIRQRAQRSPCRLPLPICQCKDASVNPMTVDAGSQTEMNVQQPLSPNVNINEYNWGSTAGSRAWETQNGPDFQPGQSYPSMQGGSYSSMSHQQMSSPFLPTGNQSMAWSPQGSLNAMPQRQNEYESLQSVPGVAIPLPCSKPPFCMPQATQPCVTLNPPCVETQPPCISLPPCVTTQPPCTPDASSYPPCVSPSPCRRPLPCVRQPVCSQSPLAVSTQPRQSLQPPCTVSPPCIAPPPCKPPPPFKPPSPCMPLPPCIPQRLTVPQNGYCPLPPPPCLSQSISPGISQRRISKKPQFRVKSSDFSSTSSPAEEYTQGQSFECQPRVTKLGSFNDDPPCRRTCSRQSPEPIRSRGSPYDECKWVQEDDDGNLGVPCTNRRPYKVSLQSKDFVCDREEARPKCHCKNHGLRKTLGRRFRGNQTPCITESMKHCSKCCGAHCPHPSYLFFK